MAGLVDRISVRVPVQVAAIYRDAAALMGMRYSDLVRTILLNSAPQVKTMVDALRLAETDTEAGRAAFAAAARAVHAEFGVDVDQMEAETHEPAH